MASSLIHNSHNSAYISGSSMQGNISIDANQITLGSGSSITVSDGLNDLVNTHDESQKKGKESMRKLFEVMVAGDVKKAIRATSNFNDALIDIFSSGIKTESSLNFIFDKFVSFDPSVLKDKPDIMVDDSRYSIIVERLVSLAELGVCAIFTKDNLKIPFYFADPYFVTTTGFTRIMELVDEGESAILTRIFDLPYDGFIDYMKVRDITDQVKNTKELYS